MQEQSGILLHTWKTRMWNEIHLNVEFQKNWHKMEKNTCGAAYLTNYRRPLYLLTTLSIIDKIDKSVDVRKTTSLPCASPSGIPKILKPWYLPHKRCCVWHCGLPNILHKIFPKKKFSVEHRRIPNILKLWNFPKNNFSVEHSGIPQPRPMGHSGKWPWKEVASHSLTCLPTFS